ncbi:RHS repeat-associated core domain-containing protein, partial [Massilia sp. TWP1-3-3]|uniref:RHS repeat-associated core domain-containing protein n=1 Tax=Massilia sp. TWP1-3-3 TaxID=2804573 RepID=UPI003CF3E3E2
MQFASKKPPQVLEWTRENGRVYDKCTSGGSFLSIDPVVTDGNTGSSFNRYAYANNSPYKYVDPDGRNPAA